MITTPSLSLERFKTNIPGLDTILRGGLFRNGMYLIGGTSGAGKTILGNQLCFEHIRAGSKAIYLTLATESHADMLMYLRSLNFFDANVVAKALQYFSGLGTLDTEGLQGLLTLLRQVFREQHPTLFVMDGLTTIESAAETPQSFRKFLQELHTVAELSDCTVILLTNTTGLDTAHPEYMVMDGLIELSNPLIGQQAIRHLRVLKFRGSSYLQGQHIFQITDAGIIIHPRTEARIAIPTAVPQTSQEKQGFSSPTLDKMLGGGLPDSSITMLLGIPGSGKTVLGLHFLAAGRRADEHGLYFGFYEMPPYLIQNAKQLGLDFTSDTEQRGLEIIWHPTLLDDVDALTEQLLDAVQRHQVKRLFIDGLAGFQEALDYPERLRSFLSALTNELRVRGVTSLMSVELPNLFGPSTEMPLGGLETLVDNIILLRSVELHAQIHHLISILKMRGVSYDLAIRELVITDQSIGVGDPFTRVQATLTGIGQTEINPPFEEKGLVAATEKVEMAVILVVDDEPAIANLLAALLEDVGHQVYTANNGREGLTHLENMKPDLVLSDVMMPVMDGRALCQAMQANPGYQTIPIILMSAATEVNISNNCKYAAFLKKPFNQDTVLNIIDKVIGSGM